MGKNIEMKKIFIYNQFILCFIIIGMIISNVIFPIHPQNKYFLKNVENVYDIYFVNDTYIVSTFRGSGGWLDGGVISKNKIFDINMISKEEIETLIENDLEYKFPTESFPDNAILYIDNFDHDENIEIFAFELLGTSFIHPIEICKDGKIKEENIFTYAKLLFLTSFWMLPNFIFYFLFVTYYFIFAVVFFIKKNC